MADTGRLLDWAANRNIYIHPSVTIHDFSAQGHGNGLQVLSDIPKDTPIIKVPAAAMIIPSLEVQNRIGEVPALIVQLLIDSTSENYEPYFKVLPKSMDTPMFWSSAEIDELLKGSTLPEKIGVAEADSLWTDLCRTEFLKEEYKNIDKTNAAFHRMGSLVLAYAYDLEVDPRSKESDDDGVKAMVPIVDMINHSSEHSNVSFNTLSNGDVEITTSKDIKANEELFLSYGKLPSSDLLRRYGFVEQGGTPHETSEMKLEHVLEAARTVTSAKDFEHRVAKLQKWCMDDLEDITDFELDGQPDFELLLAANALSLPLTSRRQFEEAVEMAEDEELTSDAQRILIQALESRMAEYPDLSAVAKDTARQQMAAQVLESELEVLRKSIEWVKGATPKTSKKFKSF